MSIAITSDTATPALQRIHAAIAPGKRRDLMLTLGHAARNEYRAWFRAHDATPNAKGFPRSHFWHEIAGATGLDTGKTTDTEAVVVIASRAIKAHVYGGTWGPRPGKKNLAIPLRGEAAGKNPRDNPIAGVFFLRSRFGKGGGYLVKREGKKLMAFWRLVPRVHVRRDPAALPPAGYVAEILAKTATSFLEKAERLKS
jgi:hypothetical protein